MSDQTSNKCECGSAKKVKSLEKQIAELVVKIEQLERQVATIRKAVRK